MKKGANFQSLGRELELVKGHRLKTHFFALRNLGNTLNAE